MVYWITTIEILLRPRIKNGFSNHITAAEKKIVCNKVLGIPCKLTTKNKKMKYEKN